MTFYNPIMNINEFLKKHNFGEVEKNLLIALIENESDSVWLSRDINDVFHISLTLDQTNHLRNSWFSQYNNR
jgi:hypothetical protein